MRRPVRDVRIRDASRAPAGASEAHQGAGVAEPNGPSVTGLNGRHRAVPDSDRTGGHRGRHRLRAADAGGLRSAGARGPRGGEAVSTFWDVVGLVVDRKSVVEG